MSHGNEIVFFIPILKISKVIFLATELYLFISFWLYLSYLIVIKKELKYSLKILMIVYFVFTNRVNYFYCQSSNSENIANNKLFKYINYFNIGLGYEYGLLPFLSDVKPPQGNFKTSGYFGFNIKSLPFYGSYYYSSIGTISGLNNYFSINFDSQAYQNSIKDRIQKYKDQKIKELLDLEEKKQEIYKKIAYLDLIKNQKILVSPDDFNMSIPDIPDSLITQENYILQVDTLNSPENITAIEENPVNMEIINNSKYITWNDSLETIYSKVLDKIILLEKHIKKLHEIKNMSVDSLYQSELINAQEQTPKGFKFIKNIKKFQIGMCYPDHSYFLISRIPIKGINIEYQKNKMFYSFTHGKTVNNLFYSNNVIQNNLNYIRNIYNFFDFNNIEQGRKVTMGKIGYGSKENSHIHLGLLYGIGKTSYIDTLDTGEKENNLVAEIDSRIRITKNQTFDLIYGRSHTQINQNNFDGFSTYANNLFDINDRSNAILSMYSYKSQKSGTDLKATFRLVDPFFRSFGVGFIRSDNIRYEIKLKQKAGKKLKFGGFVRHEEDNILKLYDYNNRIFSFGFSGQYRPIKKALIKFDFRPIVHLTESGLDSLTSSNNNWIVNVIRTYRNRIKKVYYDLTGMYSFYQLFNGTQNNIYQNINFSGSIRKEGKWAHNLSYNQFISTDTMSLPISNIIEYVFDFNKGKWTTSAIGKFGFSSSNTPDYGFGYKIKRQINKTFSMEITGEKLIIGDFYNSLLADNVRDFPYYFSSTIRINL